MSNGDPAVEEAKEQESEERDIEEERPLAAPEEGEKGEIVREEDILPFDPKLLEDAPPEVRQLIKMSSAMIRMGGPSFNPLAAAVAKTLDGDHLAAVIGSEYRTGTRQCSAGTLDESAMSNCLINFCWICTVAFERLRS